MMARITLPLESATAEIKLIADSLIAGSRAGRFPLFVIGAGVSRAAGIPLMVDLLNHLVSITASDTAPEVQKIADLCRRSQLTQSRADIAVIFSALQEARATQNPLRKSWTQFCRDLIQGNIRVSEYQTGHILNREPTAAHKWIAAMCLDMSAKCLSLNFDGLTRKAIRQILQTRDDGKQCIILDSPGKISSYFGRDPQKADLCAVFKLRGDIFYAICRTSGCPLENTITPVYELPESRLAREERNFIPCPECQEPRTLQIAFPGYHLKEQESESILEALWRYIVPGISQIFVMGFSGEWDRVTVDFLFKAARTQNVGIVDVRLPPQKNASHYMYDVWRREYPTVKYQALYGTADDFAGAMSAASQPLLLDNTSPNPKLRRYPQDIESDMIWRKSKAETRNDIAGGICKMRDVEHLKWFSQLGLKTFWWGAVKTFSVHNRYYHSLGAMRVAEDWFQTITGSRRSTDDFSRERELLLICMILHDYGHLPFSHLFEGIFDELHWMPSEQPTRPWHEVLVREKIERLLKQNLPGSSNTISQYLEELGYDIGQVLQLIQGSTGKTYLDAIVNSPIDADKIDYVFRDVHHLQFGSSLPPDRTSWLKEFLTDQDLSPEGMIRLNRRSALRALELLETRRKLYFKFYLCPEQRMMERITSFILICSLAHLVPTKMLEYFRTNGSPAFSVDHGPLKVKIVSEIVMEAYLNILAPSDRTAEANTKSELREKPLLDYFIKELQTNHFNMNTKVIEVVEALKTLLDQFPNDRDDEPYGQRVHQLYQKLHVAGPYYAKASDENNLQEIVRGLTLLYPGSVLFDVVKTPKFLAGPPTRDFSQFWIGRKEPVIGETYLVPSADLSKWTIKSPARVPLQLVNFGNLQTRYVQILIFDPRETTPEAEYVHQQFLRNCDKKGIRLDETPAI